MFMFYDSILLRSVRISGFMDNSTTKKKIIHDVVHKFKANIHEKDYFFG